MSPGRTGDAGRDDEATEPHRHQLLRDGAMTNRLVERLDSRGVVGVALVVSLSILGCGKESPAGPAGGDAPTPVATTLTLSASVLSFSSLGATEQLSATVLDQNGATMAGASLAWASSASSVASISPTGLITAVADGTATITATTDGVNGTATVVVDQVSTQSTFTVQPTKTPPGTSITPAVEVEIQDALGHTVADATDAVTLAVSYNPNGGSLSGTLTRSAVNGVATFDDLSIDNAGAGYTLSATSGNLAAAMSEAFDIEPAACTDDTGTVVTLTFSGDAQPVLNWDPACSVAQLLIEQEGGGDLWHIFTDESVFFDPAQANLITPPLTYGVVPTGVRQSSEADNLITGVLQVLLVRSLGDGGGWARFGTASCVISGNSECLFVLQEFM